MKQDKLSLVVAYTAIVSASLLCIGSVPIGVWGIIEDFNDSASNGEVVFDTLALVFLTVVSTLYWVTAISCIYARKRHKKEVIDVTKQQ